MRALTGSPTLLALPPATARAFGLPPGVNGLTSFNKIARVSDWQQDTSSWAVFFQGEYQINDSVTLTAGLRYTEEDKDAIANTRISNDTGGLANPTRNSLTGAVLRGVTATSYNHSFVDSRTTDQTTPSVSLEWSQSDANNYYINYSEGFKSGGFNAVDDQAPDILRHQPLGSVYTIPGAGWSYEDETANSIEIGGKHQWLDGSLEFNWTVFDSLYENQQVSTFVGIGFDVPLLSGSHAIYTDPGAIYGARVSYKF